ncbi:MAG: hypothetical protein QXG58_07630 [Candidatus Bathyarchaeia archaeon]
MISKEQLKELCRFYLLALIGALAIITSVALLYAIFAAKPFLEALRWAFIIGTLILIGIGFVSVLPLSEYRYIRGAGINPVIAREGMRHIRTGRESKRMGVILGIAGLTLFLIYCAIFS